MLGPVRVLGAARPIRRPWALELVVYLALHPEGATSDAWATALWPDRVVADPTRHSTVSAARRALGRSAAGRDHLPHGRGTLRLCSSVGTDWDRFCHLARRPEPTSWAAALALVRGRPFDGLRGGGDWTVLEGVGPQVEDGIVQVALRMAEHQLAAGDGHGAERAARAGLRACPYDERLYRALLRAADVQGNPAGVERVMGELLRLVGAGPVVPGELDRWVHPATADLYGALSRRRGGSPVAHDPACTAWRRAPAGTPLAVAPAG